MVRIDHCGGSSEEDDEASLMPSPVPWICLACVEVEPTVPPAVRVQMLNRYSKDGAQDPAFAKIATNLYSMLANRLGRRPNAYELLNWLMARVHDFVDYEPDFEGREIFQPVQSTLWNGQGRTISPITGRRKGADDCEGLAAVVVGWALALGIRAGNVWNDQPDAAQNHVTAEACDGGTFPVDWTGCIPLETTIPGAYPGETTTQVINRVGPTYRARIYGGTSAAGDPPAAPPSPGAQAAPFVGAVGTGLNTLSNYWRNEQQSGRQQATIDLGNAQASAQANAAVGSAEAQLVLATAHAQLNALAQEQQAHYGSPPLPTSSTHQAIVTGTPHTPSKAPLVIGVLLIGGAGLAWWKFEKNGKR